MKMDAFKTAQKVNKHLDHLCRQICHRELSKIVQSGHIDGRSTLRNNCAVIKLHSHWTQSTGDSTIDNAMDMVR